MNVNSTPKLVSESEDIGMIHKSIVENIFSNEIVVCDVSGKNANVMFELGIRLTFEKPTVIIKDDHTDYSFDTSPLKHIEYPRDLRHNKIELFINELKTAIIKTYARSIEEGENYKIFIKHFGPFKIPSIDSKNVEFEEFVLEELRELKNLQKNKIISESNNTSSISTFGFYLNDAISNEEKNNLINNISFLGWQFDLSSDNFLFLEGPKNFEQIIYKNVKSILGKKIRHIK
ncbi:MAG: hypothetical protein R2879_22100 [Saprospiraceae bacterium]